MAKRENGRSTKFPGVKDLGDGEYRVRAYYTDPVTGREKEKDRVIRAASTAAAYNEKLRLEEELKAPPMPHSQLTVGAAATAWLEAKARPARRDGTATVTPATVKRYTWSVEKVIVPYLGDVAVAKLNRDLIESFRDELGTRFAAATVNGYLRVLKEVLRRVESPAADRVKPLPEDDVRHTEDEPNKLTPAQLALFLRAAAEHTPEHYAEFMVLATTGMRIGAMLALRREDFDTQAGVIRVRRRVSEGVVLDGVKRGRDARDEPPLLPEVAAAALIHWERFSEAQLDSGLAFPTADGKVGDRGRLRKPLVALRKVCGIEIRFTTHGFRRTAATLYRRIADPVVAKAIVGHVTDAMHAHYAGPDRSERMEAGARLFALVGKTGDQTGDRKAESKNDRSA